MVRILAVEGNVGAGKSTLLTALESTGVCVVREPVHQWTEHIRGAYGSDRAWKLPMQMMSLTTREEALHRAARVAREHSVDTVVVERSNASGDLFARATLASDEYAAFALTRDRYDAIAERAGTGVCKTIYLRVDPAECERRIGMRNRAGEEGVSAEFLRALHEAHEAAFAATATVVDATSMSAEAVAAFVQTQLGSAT